MGTCLKCVMDASDVDIVFDAAGICNHCHAAERLLPTVRFSEKESKSRLNAMRDQIVAAGRGKRYDCLLPLSGGVDSSFVAHIAQRMGLRPLAVHLDNGWNSKAAVSNIEKIVEKCGFDLNTCVIDWKEFRDLQRSFLKASVIDVEMITDHAITATIFQTARKFGIKTVLLGTNLATEHGLPRSWSWRKQDLRNIKAIHRQFGEVKLRSYPRLGMSRYLYYWYGGAFKIMEPLNNVNYSNTEAIETLQRVFNWERYGDKHHKSVFTKFYQGHILPEKFGVDKRKLHYSDRIRNGECTREYAMEQLQKPVYTASELDAAREYVCRKLELTDAEFGEIMAAAPRQHLDFASEQGIVDALKGVANVLRRPARVAEVQRKAPASVPALVQ